MFTLWAFHIPTDPAPEDCFLDLIIDALEEKGRLPDRTPDVGLGCHHLRENLKHLTVVKVDRGWVVNIIFNKKCLDGRHDTMSSSALTPFPTAAAAVHYGAATVCQIVTGSAELPFEVVGDILVMV